MHVHVPNACLMAVEARRICGFLIIGVTDGGGPLCGCWEPNLSSLEEQLVLLATRSSL